MITIIYEISNTSLIIVDQLISNRYLTVDEALDIISFNEQEFIVKYGLDEIDYNNFKLLY